MSEESKDRTGTGLNGGTLICVVQDVLRRWLLLVMVALLAAIGTCIWKTAAYTPSYTATATFVATVPGTNSSVYQNLSATAGMAEVFSEVLGSSLLRNEVTRLEDLPAFDGTVSAAAIPDTNLLTMTVTGNDPRAVFLMSRAVIEHHHTVSAPLLGSTVLEVLQEPRVPSAPSNPLNLRNTMLKMAALAAAASAGLIAVLSYFSRRIRSREEADRELSCHVLGQLRHERKHRGMPRLRDLRRKKGLLITDPAVSFLYTEAVAKLASRAEKRLRDGENVLMVTSLLENEGKSTVAVNLALSLAKKGHRVLLADCDLRKPACHLLLGLSRNGPGVSAVLAGQADLARAVQRVKGTDLLALCGGHSLRTATDLATSAAMAELLAQAGQAYDFVIVDTPPMSLAPDAEGIAAACHAALLVVRQNAADAPALNKAIEALKASGTHLLGCVLNNVYGADTFAPAYTDRLSQSRRYGYGYGYGYGRKSTGKEEQP